MSYDPYTHYTTPYEVLYELFILLETLVEPHKSDKGYHIEVGRTRSSFIPSRLYL